MKFFQRQSLRLKNFDYASQGCYFVTICTKNRAMLLWKNYDQNNGPILSDNGVEIKRVFTFLEMQTTNFIIDTYTIMPNHIHLLITIQEHGQRSISSMIHQFKCLTTKRIGTSIWQRSFFDHIIRSNEEYKVVWDYIQNNPAKWIEDEYFVF